MTQKKTKTLKTQSEEENILIAAPSLSSPKKLGTHQKRHQKEILAWASA